VRQKKRFKTSAAGVPAERGEGVAAAVQQEAEDAAKTDKECAGV
jgi:hypothetical protein